MTRIPNFDYGAQLWHNPGYWYSLVDVADDSEHGLVSAGDQR